MRVWLVLTLILTACSDSGSDPVDYFKVETPRPYGYVIGDEIPVRILFETRPDVNLQRNALPAKGPISRWLNLNDVKVKQNGQRYRIDLIYQVFYAPQSVKSLTLPGFELRFNLGKLQSSHAVPSWQFRMSPLRELAIRGQDAGDPLRPDALPPLLDDAAALSGLAGGLGLALIAGAYLAFLYGCWPGSWRRSLFKQALKMLRRVSAREMEQALVIVHQALNRLNGNPLYPDQLPGFYRTFPDYRRVHSQLEWFFNYSNHFFFSRHVSATDLDLQKIIALCEQCRKIERGG